MSSSPDTDDRELLRQLMAAHDGGLTQAELAALLGMTQPGINNVMTGKSQLSRVGRAFALYLLREDERRSALPIADWAAAIRQIADEIEAAELPPEYRLDNYLMDDVG